mmetsp:Transcript_11697/g.30486  ORF Transcript_11697/g.30486 Transcript_11697/m.30486 type:complete len:97 (-) Transcript_11697:244-534(-)|eukprot:CAMPEP_0119410120 /NCGR_PEP_ID=MMETSP1335-20130426/3233_1 /TAXON_ID=259385 /ORGANISM="Chrysoculter rhomboideus, Strain RCC1486" /LENGTH=96 /DNA_ID=CAMNT_0007434601 /DNA_START=105 /DNA_END=395 /DNA_ORIENTATION=-
MSGVLVPDDEAMIDDTPQPSASVHSAMPPEVLLLHTRICVALAVLIVCAFGLSAILWRRYWPILCKFQHDSSAIAKIPESPTTRGLRERLDKKKRR